MIRYFGFWLSVLALAGWTFACNQLKKDTRQVFTQDDVAVELARDVEILYSDSAVVRVRVTGPVMLNNIDRENPHREFPEGVKIDFLEPDLSIKSTLTAKTAVQYPDKGRIIARDSVVLTTVKKERLETEELIWDEKTAKVFTEKFVKVTKPGEVIYGFGLEAEQDFSYWKITVPKGRIKVDQLNEVLK
ncbi:MAG: LPS export ABC transporter periplasmic protein LptC [Lewinellaceae bacterium]|nr:LPS export ABC transporter periplasmic protein LptC [Lewinellaceae bacterium]